MSPLGKAIDGLAKTAVEVLWAQWHALGAPAATSGRTARAIVDPEALLLGSLALAARERRFHRFVRVWTVRGARVLSAQRTRNLVRDYDPAVVAALGEFAAAAVREGDLRWRSLAGDRAAEAPRSKDVNAGPLVTEPAGLMVRVRLALGVGIKADVFTFLAGMQGARRGVGAVTAATGYTTRAVRRAVDELAAARFIEAWTTAPASFSVDAERWAHALRLQEMPRWVYWHPLFALVTELDRWWRESGAMDLTPYMQSSRLRDLLERRGAMLEHAGVLVPLADYPGEDLLPAAAAALRALGERMTRWV